jgi:putative FmdB family regulatory protein
MPMYDFQCESCDTIIEDLVAYGTPTIPCTKCDGLCSRIFLNSPRLFTTIIPEYPGSKKRKAGYVHSHQDKPATKIQVNGCSWNEGKKSYN